MLKCADCRYGPSARIARMRHIYCQYQVNYAKCCYADCPILFIVMVIYCYDECMLSVVRLNVVVLSVIILNVVILSVAGPSARIARTRQHWKIAISNQAWRHVEKKNFR
jgi:hypothetical protein